MGLGRHASPNKRVRIPFYPHKRSMRGLRDAVDPAGGAERFSHLLFAYDRRDLHHKRNLADGGAELPREHYTSVYALDGGRLWRYRHVLWKPRP